MSAFVVNNQHINAMLQASRFNQALPAAPSYYWKENGSAEQRHIRPSDQAIGQILVDENFASVNYRYQNNGAGEPFQFQPLPFQKRYSMVQVLKACNCYIYQACEHPDWESSEAHAIVKALKARAIVLLPGYEDSMWEVLEV